MNYLLDTNALLWWLSDDKRLGSKSKSLISNPGNTIYLSNLSLLECSIKVGVGKLKLNFNELDQALIDYGFVDLNYDTVAAKEYVNVYLPQSDPFDKAITAQAISKHMNLITSDHKILEATLRGLYLIDAAE